MKINISKWDVVFAAVCTGLGGLGGAAVGLISEKLEPAYGRGYAQGKDDTYKEISDKLKEGLEEIKAHIKEEEDKKENETEDEEEDGS